jgi:hypothetical protein
LGISDSGGQHNFNNSPVTAALGGRDVSRKILEAFVARRIESAFSRIKFYGFTPTESILPGLYGLETASQAYWKALPI